MITRDSPPLPQILRFYHTVRAFVIVVRSSPRESSSYFRQRSASRLPFSLTFASFFERPRGKFLLPGPTFVTSFFYPLRSVLFFWSPEPPPPFGVQRSQFVQLDTAPHPPGTRPCTNLLLSSPPPLPPPPPFTVTLRRTVVSTSSGPSILFLVNDFQPHPTFLSPGSSRSGKQKCPSLRLRIVPIQVPPDESNPGPFFPTHFPFLFFGRT